MFGFMVADPKSASKAREARLRKKIESFGSNIVKELLRFQTLKTTVEPKLENEASPQTNLWKKGASQFSFNEIHKRTEIHIPISKNDNHTHT
jgi:hypothetical protein